MHLWVFYRMWAQLKASKAGKTLVVWDENSKTASFVQGSGVNSQHQKHHQRWQQKHGWMDEPLRSSSKEGQATFTALPFCVHYEGREKHHYLLTIKYVWSDTCYEEEHILVEKSHRGNKQPMGKKGSQQVGVASLLDRQWKWFQHGNDKPSHVMGVHTQDKAPKLEETGMELRIQSIPVSTSQCPYQQVGSEKTPWES